MELSRAIEVIPPRDAEESRNHASTRGVLLLCLWCLPTLLTTGVLFVSIRDHKLGVDFVHGSWLAARDVLHGHSPFPPPSLTAISQPDIFVYPAPAALLVTPFGVLPSWAAVAVFTVLLLGAVFIALRLAGVRDRRCYAAAFLWAPVLSAIQTGNLTLLLAVGLALAWRFRARTVAGGALVGVLIALKIFLWPLLIWLIATRKYAGVAWAMVTATALTFGSWAVLDFKGMRDYPEVLRLLQHVYEKGSYTPFVVLLKLGFPTHAAREIAFVLGFGVLLLAVLACRRGSNPRAAFALAVAASLLLSPIVWLHYFTLLIVPLAVLRPRFGLVWLLPALLWLCPVGSAGPVWLAALPLVVFGAMLALAINERLATSIVAAAPRLPGRNLPALNQQAP